MAGLFYIFFALVMMPQVASAGEPEHFLSSLDTQTFQRVKSTRDDILVVFCDEAAEGCQHMVESLEKLTVIWKGMNQFLGAQFAKVSCTKDRDLCEQEGITAVPSAVHYRNGVRIATWQVQGGQPSPVWEFVAWVRTQLTPATPKEEPTDIPSDATSHFSLSRPFADMDDPTAGVGWCLVVLTLGIITWVVVEGFELWPADKAQQHGNSVPAF